MLGNPIKCPVILLFPTLGHFIFVLCLSFEMMTYICYGQLPLAIQLAFQTQGTLHIFKEYGIPFLGNMFWQILETISKSYL